MTSEERKKIQEIELKLSSLKQTRDQFIPIFNQIDRKLRSILLNIKELDDERTMIQQGQMTFTEMDF